MDKRVLQKNEEYIKFARVVIITIIIRITTMMTMICLRIYKEKGLWQRREIPY